MDEARIPSSRMRAERIRDLYGDRGWRGFVGTGIVALLGVEVAVLVWRASPSGAVLAWLAALFAALALQALLIGRFHGRARADVELPAWGRRRALVEAVHGLAWATGASWLHRPGDTLSLIVYLSTLVGLEAGMAASFAVHMPTLLAFVCAAVLPAAAVLAWRGGGADGYAAAIMVSGLVVVVANGARMSMFYDRAIRARLDLQAQRDEGLRLRAEAEAAAAARMRFFGAASHDLRQPVHALGMYAALLRADPPKGDRRALISAIGACVDSLERLFGAILGVAQAARPAPPGGAAPVAVMDVFERLQLQFAGAAAAQGLRLEVRPSPLWVKADAAVLERILANLVGNALRYTRRGGVRLRAERRDGRVGLIVADTGVGLSAADRQNVFEPFYQGEAARSGPRVGFGLGLATVRELCRAHGFGVTVRSRPGRGAVFRIAAPAADAPPARSDSLGEREGGGAPATIAGGRRVLLVEDDPLVADAMRRLLTSWSVEVSLAAGREAALGALAAAPDAAWLVLLDYRLAGGETGLDVAAAIRRQFQGNASLYLVTAEADPAISPAAARLGVPVLQKPLKPIRLRALLAAPGAPATPGVAAD